MFLASPGDGARWPAADLLLTGGTSYSWPGSHTVLPEQDLVSGHRLPPSCAGSRSRTSPPREACHTAAGRPPTGPSGPSLRWGCQAAAAFSRDGNESAAYTSIENLAIVWASIDRLGGGGALLAQAGVPGRRHQD